MISLFRKYTKLFLLALLIVMAFYVVDGKIHIALRCCSGRRIGDLRFLMMLEDGEEHFEHFTVAHRISLVGNDKIAKLKKLRRRVVRENFCIVGIKIWDEVIEVRVGARKPNNFERV